MVWLVEVSLFLYEEPGVGLSLTFFLGLTEVVPRDRVAKFVRAKRLRSTRRSPSAGVQPSDANLLAPDGLCQEVVSQTGN